MGFTPESENNTVQVPLQFKTHIRFYPLCPGLLPLRLLNILFMSPLIVVGQRTQDKGDRNVNVICFFISKMGIKMEYFPKIR